MAAKKPHLKQEILKLREQGLSYREIGEILGCSSSAVGHYCTGDRLCREHLEPAPEKKCKKCGEIMPRLRKLTICRRCVTDKNRMKDRVCTVCKVKKKSGEFPLYFQKTKMPDGGFKEYSYARRTCRSCNTSIQKEREKKKCGSEEQAVEYRREISFRHKTKRYGITSDEARSMLSGQDSKCSICSCEISFYSESRNTQACFDHNHTTGRLRGLLCSRCNSAMGLLRDDTNIAHKLIEYLENTREFSP